MKQEAILLREQPLKQTITLKKYKGFVDFVHLRSQ